MKELKELISAIGQKRFIILVILLAINAGLGGLWQKVLLPQKDALTNEMAAVQSERNKLQQEITELPVKHALLEANEKRYQSLKDNGMFNPQDRIEARTKVDLLREESGLRGINYQIEAQEVLQNNLLTTPDQEIIRSKMSIEMSALSDVEALGFIEKMKTEFSGLVIVNDIKLERGEEVTYENLSKLTRGEAIDFIKGKAEFVWYSIVPKPVNAGAATGAPQ